MPNDALLLTLDRATTSFAGLPPHRRSQRLLSRSGLPDLPATPPTAGFEQERRENLAAAAALQAWRQANQPEAIARRGGLRHRQPGGATLLWHRRSGALLGLGDRLAGRPHRRPLRRLATQRPEPLVRAAPAAAGSLFQAPARSSGWLRRAAAGAAAAAAGEALLWHRQQLAAHGGLTGARCMPPTAATPQPHPAEWSLERGQWDPELCAPSGAAGLLPVSWRPATPTSAHHGGAAFAVCRPGHARRSQAATLVRHCCSRVKPKCTYGTGRFLVMHTGSSIVRSDGAC